MPANVIIVAPRTGATHAMVGQALSQDVTVDSTAADEQPALALMALVECLLFVAGRPLALRELARALQAPSAAVEAAIGELATRGAGRGLIIQRLGDQVQLVTHPAASSLVQRFLGQEAEAGLSTAALETAAVIAYRQPITRAEIETIRGTSCERPLAQLMAQSLIRVLGRRQSPGRPFEYGTTFEFLQAFGLRSLDTLPSIEQQSTEPA